MGINKYEIDNIIKNEIDNIVNDISYIMRNLINNYSNDYSLNCFDTIIKFKNYINEKIENNIYYYLNEKYEIDIEYFKEKNFDNRLSDINNFDTITYLIINKINDYIKENIDNIKLYYHNAN